MKGRYNGGGRKEPDLPILSGSCAFTGKRRAHTVWHHRARQSRNFRLSIASIGYKKIVITMDDDPFVHLRNGYKKINALEFLLDSNCLKTL